jgi:hypothetical protein
MNGGHIIENKTQNVESSSSVFSHIFIEMGTENHGVGGSIAPPLGTNKINGL